MCVCAHFFFEFVWLSRWHYFGFYANGLCHKCDLHAIHGVTLMPVCVPFMSYSTNFQLACFSLSRLTATLLYRINQRKSPPISTVSIAKKKMCNCYIKFIRSWSHTNSRVRREMRKKNRDVKHTKRGLVCIISVPFNKLMQHKCFETLLCNIQTLNPCIYE